MCQAQSPDHASRIVLDRVAAVVNNRVILESDIDDEVKLSILDPTFTGKEAPTRQGALDRLVSRALIEQQIREEDAAAATPSRDEVETRMKELRTMLPACVRRNCASDDGWKVFLAENGLSAQHVQAYARYRLEILRFIEQRFRPGIHIDQSEIERYYRDILLPGYVQGETVPPLEQVAPRIEDILLEQQVNALFDQWLANLRKQGDVEVLDSSLEAAEKPAATGDGKP